MTRKLFLSVFLVIVAAAAFWLFNSGKPVDVETVKPQWQPAVQAVYATGTVEASAMIPISPKVAARLMTLEVDEGAKVVKGQVLGQLEDADLQQNLTELQARLDLAGRDLARAQKLARTGALAKNALDEAQANYKTAAAAVERAKAELSYLQLTAPEDGTIIRRDGEIGELITVGTPVFWINGGDRIRIATEVDEEDIGLVQIGQRVLISADAFPGKTFNGKVASITPKGDAVARSYRVRVTFDEAAPLMIGMTSETNIITQEKDRALMIPATAVKGDAIYIVTDGKPVLTKIRKGIVTDKSIEIVEGVKEGDSVALRYNDVAADPENRDKAVCNMGTGC